MENWQPRSGASPKQDAPPRPPSLHTSIISLFFHRFGHRKSVSNPRYNTRRHLFKSRHPTHSKSRFNLLQNYCMQSSTDTAAGLAVQPLPDSLPLRESCSLYIPDDDRPSPQRPRVQRPGSARALQQPNQASGPLVTLAQWPHPFPFRTRK